MHKMDGNSLAPSISDSIIESFIDLILTNLDIANGRKLLIRAEPIHWGLINRITHKAYQKGAAYVRAEAVHPQMYKSLVDLAPEESLSYIPGDIQKTYEMYIEERWSFLGLFGQEDPFLLDSLDPRRNGIAAKASAEAKSLFRIAIQQNLFPWLLVPAPTPGWAGRVFNTSQSSQALEQLWQEIITILHLDQPDPAVVWRKKSDILQHRSKTLDGLKIERLHFQAGNTDLTIQLADNAQWIGGASLTEDGKSFIPNLPTEEVFTAPHRAKTNGYVRITRPVLVMEKQVCGAWFVFKDGSVVDFGADDGKEVLAQFLELDPGNKALGEVALVDADSPVFQSGHTFYSILLDENAACHIALGSAYPETIRNGNKLTKEEQSAAGLNESKLHLDFMIGTEDMDVTAEYNDREKIPIIKNGHFVI